MNALSCEAGGDLNQAVFLTQQRSSRSKAFAVDPLGMQHLIFGPIITLSLSREMTAEFPDRDTLYSVARIRASHIDLILRC